MHTEVCIPVFICERPELIDRTIQTVASIQSGESLAINIVCTTLNGITSTDLRDRCQRVSIHPVRVWHPPTHISVAAAWNIVAKHLQVTNATNMMIVANDVTLMPSAVDRLIRFGDMNPLADMWSGVHRKPPGSAAAEPEDSCDFNCLMLRPSCFEKFGYFDENFFPAYWEDTDYYCRVAVAGGCPRRCYDAAFDHDGSLSVRLEPQLRRKVDDHFEKNKARFAAKWGWPGPVESVANVLAKTHKHPWNDPALPVGFWERA